MDGAYGRLGLHEAAFDRNSTPDIIKALLKASPNDARHADKNGHLPLHVAVLVPSERNDRAKRSILQLLVEAYPEAAKAPDKDGNTPLHLAAQYFHYTAIKVLLEADPEGVQRRNADGCTPLNKLYWKEEPVRGWGHSFQGGPPIQSFIDRYKFKLVSSKICRDLASSKDPDTNYFMTGDNKNQLPLHKMCSSNEGQHPFYGGFRQYYHIKLAFGACPEAAAIADSCGDFPLNHFLRNIQPGPWGYISRAPKAEYYWKASILRLAQACPKALARCDSKSKLFPLTVIVKDIARYNNSDNRLEMLCEFILKLADLCPESLVLSNEGKNPIPFSAVFSSIYCASSSRHISRDYAAKSFEDFAHMLHQVSYCSPVDTNAAAKKFHRLQSFHRLFWETLRHLSEYRASDQLSAKNGQLPLPHMMALCGDLFSNQQLVFLFDYFWRIAWVGESNLIFMERDKHGNLPLHLVCATQSRDERWWTEWSCFLGCDNIFWSFIQNEVSNEYMQNADTSGMFETCLEGIGGILDVDTPRAVRSKNKVGELPLHIVLRSNVTPHTKCHRAQLLLREYPKSALAVHPPTKLLPFMVAAMYDDNSKCACLSATFILLGEFVASRKLSDFVAQ